MIHTDSNDFKYYESLDEIKSDGLMLIHVRSLLEFFTLAGRKTILTKDNLIPIPDLHYVVLNGEKKYYVKEYHGWSVDDLFFYNKHFVLYGEDTAIENLKRYVDDRRVWLILTAEQVANISNMLTRLYKANLNGEGKLGYREFIQILQESLELEDFIENNKNSMGFKTNCKIRQDHIAELWKKASKK